MSNKNLTDFEVFDKMATDGADISMCPDVISADKVRKGGKITFGVPLDIFEKVMGSMSATVTGKGEQYYTIMYVVNKKQFDKLKNP